MPNKKQVIGKPLVINGRQLSLSRAIRAGDFVFLTGQIPFKDGKPMTDGTIEDQTHAVLNEIKNTLAEANCQFSDVVKTNGMVNRPGRLSSIQYCLCRILS